MSDFRYFAIIGTVSLLWMTFQDYKWKRYVDDRKNWIMLGVAISILSHVSHSIWYVLGTTGVLILLHIFFRKYTMKHFGEADINSFTWISAGFAYISPQYFITFWILMLFITLFVALLKKYVFKNTSPTPFYYFILVSFIINSWYWGLYY